MNFNRRTLFFKSWLWSLIGGAALSALFWFITGIIHVFQVFNSLSDFTIIVIGISLVGNCLGAGIVIWRISEKYRPAAHKKTMRKYWQLCAGSMIVGLVLIITDTPFTALIAGWSLVPALWVLWSLPEKVEQQ